MKMISLKRCRNFKLRIYSGGVLVLLMIFLISSCNQPVANNQSANTNSEPAEENVEKNAEQASMGYSAPENDGYGGEAGVDLSVERTAILKIHEDQRQAYLKKNPSLMVDHFADNIIMVKNGQVVTPNKGKMKEQLQAHFGGVDYAKWDDVGSPTITISDDGTMASVIVEKEEARVVKKTQKRESAKRSLVYIYKKRNGIWKVDCIASTKAKSQKSI